MLDVFHLTSSSEIWDYILTIFEKKSVPEILYLRHQLDQLVYKVGTSMSSHINSFKDLINQLAAAGAPLSRPQLVPQLLHTVKHKSYDNIITILSNKDGLDFDSACFSLTEYSQCHERHNDDLDVVMNVQEATGSDTPDAAFLVRRRSNSRFHRGGHYSRTDNFSSITHPYKHCSYCDKNGHTVHECWACQYDEEHGISIKQSRSPYSKSCDYCGQSHPTKNCFKKRYDTDRNRAYAVAHRNQAEDIHADLPSSILPNQEVNHVFSDISPDQVLNVCHGSVFIIDSGATSNMTYQSQWLHNYHALPFTKVVYLADDTTCQVKGVGDLYLGSLSSTRILRGVLHVPDLHRNLLSVARLVDLSLFVGFDHTQCRIEKDGHTIATAPGQGNLFELSGIIVLLTRIFQNFLIFIDMISSKV